MIKEYKIYVDDKGSPNYEYNRKYFHIMHFWATDNCNSYQSYRILDMSDVSPDIDEMAEFTFTKEVDALAFKLRWN